MERKQTDIPEGYQKTEVGVIPEDWEVKPIGATLQIRHGKSQKLVASAFGNYPILATGGNIGFAKEYLYNKPSVLIGRKGTINKPLYMDTPFWTVDTLFYSEVNKEYSAKYLFYNFCSINWYAYNEASGVPSLNAKTIENLLIPLPPTLAEQTAIANALSDMDALIDAQEKLIHKKRLIQQGAMQELLRPKEGWVETTLFNLTNNKKELFDDGDWIEANHISNQGIRILQTGNIGIGNFVDKTNKKYLINESFNKLHCKLLQKGDLLICRLAEPAGRACILPEIGESKIVTSVDVTICRPHEDKINRKFLVQLFSTSEWFKCISENVGGTTHKRISRSALGNIKFRIPNFSEQNKISKVLSSMDTEIEQLETQLSKYKQMKTGMMQELLTGKKRLNH